MKTFQRDKLKKKWNYFKDYYLKTVLLLSALSIFLIYSVYTMFFGYNEPDLSIVIISPDEQDTEKMEVELEDLLNLEYVSIETLNPETASVSTILPARFAAGDMDVILAQESIFTEYAQKGMFMEFSGEDQTNGIPVGSLNDKEGALSSDSTPPEDIYWLGIVNKPENPVSKDDLMDNLISYFQTDLP